VKEIAPFRLYQHFQGGPNVVQSARLRI
jgi:hypothetical protein